MIFICGLPKTASTSLAIYLSYYENIYLPEVKEPHYFMKNSFRLIKKLSSYRNLYKGERGIDASTWYFYDVKTFDDIMTEYPDAKVIFIERDVIPFIKSLLRHNYRSGYEDTLDLKIAWERGALRSPKNMFLGTSFMTDYKLLFKRFKEFREYVVEHPNVMVTSYSDIIQNPVTLNNICDFLELEFNPSFKLPHANKSGSKKSGTLHFLIKLGYRVKLALGVQRSFGLNDLNLSTTVPEVNTTVELENEIQQYYSEL